MRRRAVLRGLGATVLAHAVPAAAQSPALPVVGLIFTPGPPERMLGADPESPPARAFVHGLRDLGWIDGRTIRIDRVSVAVERKTALAQITAIKSRGSKVNVVAGARWLQDAALEAAPDVPVLSLFHEDPVATGLVDSLGRPGRQITGVTSATGPELDGKRIQFLRELVPAARRIAYVGPRNQFEQFRVVAPPDLTLIPAIVEHRDRYEAAFAAARDHRPDVVLSSAGPVNYGGFPSIVRWCAEHRLPAVYAAREAVDGGGLMSYGPSIPQAFRQLAEMTHRILKGERVSEIAVEQPTKFELVVNTRVAKSLGLAVPASLLAFADDIVE